MNRLQAPFGPRTLAAAGLACLLVGGHGLPQETDPASEQPDTSPQEVGLVEEAESRLAQLDVTVTGPDASVASLTRQDFQLVINGNLVPEFTVDRVCRDLETGTLTTREVPAESPPAQSEEQPIGVPAGSLPINYLFYFDQPFLTMAGRNKSLTIARDMIDELIRHGDRATVVSSGSAVTTYADLSSDPDELLHAIDRIDKDPQQWDPTSITEESRIDQVLEEISRGDTGNAYSLAKQFQADERWRTDKALRRFSMVLGRMADLDPPKVVIYFADRMRKNPGEYYLGFFGRVEQQREGTLQNLGADADFGAAAFDNVVAEANANGTRVYTVEAEGMVGLNVSSRRTSSRGSESTSGNQHIRTAQDSLVGLAAETGGRAFLNGIGTTKIVDQIQSDLSCLYLFSFSPAGFPENESLPVRVRVSKPKVEAHTRGMVVFQSGTERLTSRLMAAFTAPAAMRSDHPISATVVPTGFSDGSYQALVQVSVGGLPLPSAVWDIGVSVLSKSKVQSDDAGRIRIRGSGTPIVFESLATFKPGPFEIMAVAHEVDSDEIATTKLTGSFPDINDQNLTVGPIAVIQPAHAAFLRQGETRTSGSLGRGAGDRLQTDLPTALISIVCRDRNSKTIVTVERALIGASEAQFEPLELDLRQEQCAQVRDMVKAGTMTDGRFTYELRVVKNGVDVATGVREFAAASASTPEEGPAPTPAEGS